MKKYCCFLGLLVLSIFTSCNNEDFNPITEDNGFMVFCVLDNRLGSQFAVMQKSYFFENVKKMPESAQLILSEDGGPSYSFIDTTINGYDKYSCYYLPGLKLKRGVRYRLNAINGNILTQYGDICYCHGISMWYADTTLWFQPKSGSQILKEASVFSFNKSGDYYAKIKFFIDYELRYGSRIKKGRTEIPITLKGDPELDLMKGDIMKYWRYQYPAITEQTFIETFTTPYDSKCKLIFYDHDQILFALRFIDPSEKEGYKDPPPPTPDEIIIKKAFAVINLIDKNIYAFANGSTDFSFRLDESFYYTNIYSETGSGSGFFGANAEDTITFRLNPRLLNILGYTDKQK